MWMQYPDRPDRRSARHRVKQDNERESKIFQLMLERFPEFRLGANDFWVLEVTTVDGENIRPM